MIYLHVLYGRFRQHKHAGQKFLTSHVEVVLITPASPHNPGKSRSPYIRVTAKGIKANFECNFEGIRPFALDVAGWFLFCRRLKFTRSFDCQILKAVDASGSYGKCLSFPTPRFHPHRVVWNHNDFYYCFLFGCFLFLFCSNGRSCLRPYYAINSQFICLLESADSLVQWEELSENIRGGEKAFASSLKPYNDYSVRLPRAEIDKYKDYIKRQAAFIRLFKPSLRDIEIRERLEGDYVRCHSIFIYDDAQLDFAFESTGIKKLANLFSCLERAANGGIVFVDELDANIAGACLTQLVRFMNEYGQGQLLFTAHAIDPMDALAEKSKAIYFIGEDNEVTAWTKNGTKKPQILYPRGLVPGIPFNMEPFDFLSSLLKEGD